VAFPAINVNDSVTKSKFNKVRHPALADRRHQPGTDVLIGGKALWSVDGTVGKGCPRRSRLRVRVLGDRGRSINALQALMDGSRQDGRAGHQGWPTRHHRDRQPGHHHLEQ